MEKVLVTGATGYIALHCVQQLLDKGYAVNGSIRSPERKNEIIDALKNSNDSIGLTAISNDPRIKRFFTKTYSVVDIYCKRNKLSKRKLCSAIISEIY